MSIHIPPIKIQGIKTKLVETIKEHVSFSKNSIWYEPFMGSGVVGLNVLPGKAVFGDINPYVIKFYNELKSGAITASIVKGYLENEGALLAQKDDVHYYEVRNRFNSTHQSLDFLFLNRCCFNGMIRFNKNNDFNVPYGHKPLRFSKAYITKIVNQVSYLTRQIKQHDWEFRCCSFKDLIPLATESDFIYCDPPYIGRHVDYYDTWNEEQEKLLHECLEQTNAKYMVSTWERTQYRSNPYLETIWANTHRIHKHHFYHVGAKEENRSAVIEALLMNYSATQITGAFMLQDFVYEKKEYPV